VKAIDRILTGMAGFLALTLVASCAAPPKAPPPPPPAPVPAPRPAPPPPLPSAPADWRDAPQTPGTWTWRMEGALSAASFGAPGQAALARIVCDRAGGQVWLSRQASASAAVPMQVTTADTSRPLTGEGSGMAAGWIAAALNPRDPLLDAIAFSRGRFAFEAAGEPTLYLPSSPEISRVIEDCR